MLLRLCQKTPLEPLKRFNQAFKVIGQARYLATVEGNTTRQMPFTRTKATPVSHDRATFTIRVESNPLNQ